VKELLFATTYSLSRDLGLELRFADRYVTKYSATAEWQAKFGVQEAKKPLPRNYQNCWAILSGQWLCKTFTNMILLKKKEKLF
jgi:hypothetical protein